MKLSLVAVLWSTTRTKPGVGPRALGLAHWHHINLHIQFLKKHIMYVI